MVCRRVGLLAGLLLVTVGLGFDYVLVNGEFTVDEGRLTGALPGVVIDRNATRPAAP